MDDIIADGITYEIIKQTRSTTASMSVGYYIKVQHTPLSPSFSFTMEKVTKVERTSGHYNYITDKGNKVNSYGLIPYYRIKKPPPLVFNHGWGSNNAGDAAAGGGYRNRKSAKKVRRRRQNKTSRRNTKKQRTRR